MINKKLIKNYFKNYNKLQIVKNLPKFLQNNPEIEMYLNHLLAKEPNWLNIRNLLYSIVFNEHLKHCEFCGKVLDYNKTFYKKRRFCSPKCKMLNITHGYSSLSTNNYVKLLTPKSEYDGLFTGKVYQFKCLHCGHEFESKIKSFSYFPKNQFLPPCPKCCINSYIQTKVFNSLVEHFGSNYTFVQNDRKLLSNHIYKNNHVPEIDIVVYKDNRPVLGIEVNSSWTHSKQRNNNNFDINRHLNKVKWANEIGLRLLYIWDWDIDDLINKIIELLEGKENLTFTDEIIQLDRGWFNNIDIPGYSLIGDMVPKLINYNGYDVADCGKLVYIKKLGN